MDDSMQEAEEYWFWQQPRVFFADGTPSLWINVTLSICWW